MLTAAARWLYNTSQDHTFQRDLSASLLQVAVIGVGGAVLDLITRGLNHWKSIQGIRRDLLVRLRNVHVGVERVQLVLAAAQSAETYIEQMHSLMLVVPELEDIAEDVKQSRGIFPGRVRVGIVCGIDQMVSYLRRMYDEYIAWAKSGQDPNWPALKSISELVCSVPNFPAQYACGLNKSKGVVRKYVYGKRGGPV